MALIPLFKWMISPLSSGKLFQRGGRSSKIIFLCKETWPKRLYEEILVRFYSQVFLTLSPFHSRYLEKYLSKVLTLWYIWQNYPAPPTKWHGPCIFLQLVVLYAQSKNRADEMIRNILFVWYFNLIVPRPTVTNEFMIKR